MNRPHYLSSKTSGEYGTRLECECDSGPWVKYKEMVKLRARDELEDKVAFHLGPPSASQLRWIFLLFNKYLMFIPWAAATQVPLNLTFTQE